MPNYIEVWADKCLGCWGGCKLLTKSVRLNADFGEFHIPVSGKYLFYIAQIWRDVIW